MLLHLLRETASETLSLYAGLTRAYSKYFYKSSWLLGYSQRLSRETGAWRTIDSKIC